MSIVMRPWVRDRKVFLVWCPEDGETADDAREVESTDAEDAAEDYAEWSDSNGDYTIINGNEATLYVRLKGSDEPASVFVVSGEAVPQYTAREKQ